MDYIKKITQNTNKCFSSFNIFVVFYFEEGVGVYGTEISIIEEIRAYLSKFLLHKVSQKSPIINNRVFNKKISFYILPTVIYIFYETLHTTHYQIFLVLIFLLLEIIFFVYFKTNCEYRFIIPSRR